MIVVVGLELFANTAFQAHFPHGAGHGVAAGGLHLVIGFQLVGDLVTAVDAMFDSLVNFADVRLNRRGSLWPAGLCLPFSQP